MVFISLIVLVGIAMILSNNITKLTTSYVLNEQITIIDFEHQKIHEGLHYVIANFTTLNVGDTLTYLINTSNNTYVHLTWDISGTTQTETRLYENTTVTGGLKVIPVSNNRARIISSTTNFLLNPTVTDAGFILYAASDGDVTNPSKANLDAQTLRNHEFILKPDTLYLLQITSRDNDNIVTYNFNWYENENR